MGDSEKGTQLFFRNRKELRPFVRSPPAYAGAPCPLFLPSLFSPQANWDIPELRLDVTFTRNAD
jgi:hypothetical protein